MSSYDACLELAQAVMRSYLTQQRRLLLDTWLERIPQTRRAVFVSIWTSDGDLVGSVGRLLPRFGSLAEEIMENTLAALNDERFDALDADDAAQLKVGLRILSGADEIHDLGQLDHRVYGVIAITPDRKLGWALPSEESVGSLRDQLALACFRGRINPRWDQVRLYRFVIEEELED